MKLLFKYTAVILTFLLLFGTVSIYASELSNKKNELNKVQSQISQQQKKLAQTKQKEKNVLAELNSLEKQIDDIQKDLKIINNDLTETQKLVDEAEKSLAITAEKLNQHTDQLNARVKEMYIHGNIDYLEILLNAKNFSDFITRAKILKLIIKQDVELKEQIKAEKKKYEEKKKALDQQKARILALQQESLNKERKMQITVASREQLLSQIQKEKALYEQSLNELEQASRQLERMIQSLEGSNQGYTGNPSSGGFLWPTAGKITSSYGWRTHPIYKVRKFHTGIDIGAPSGQSIKAAADGLVIYSGWVNGYGNTLIIDHGNGITTLYGHTSKLLVGKGKVVKAGDVVAKVGSTGNSTGPHLHFEVRKNGVPINPMDWL